MVLGVQTQHRRGTAAQWSASGKILADGELGLATDSKIIKMGDGVNEWDDLPVAFSNYYLSAGGTAVNSALLEGISSSGFVKVIDTDTAATADKVAKRTAAGRLLAANGSAGLEVVNYDQMSLAVLEARRELISRDVSANITLALTDAGKMIRVNSTAYATSYTVTIPLDSSVNFPVGSWVDICAPGKGYAVIVPTGGVAYFSLTTCYGSGSVFRLIKTAGNAWHCIPQYLSPGPILRRKVKIGAGGATMGGGFTKIRLDGADVANATNNADSLGTNEQFDGATDIYKCYVRRSGWYDVQGQVTVSEAFTGRMYTTLYVNNVSIPIGGSTAKNSLPDTGARFTDLIPLNVGDYVELYAFREAGTTATVVETLDSPSYFAWAWRRPL